jgi:hypothetical protein
MGEGLVSATIRVAARTSPRLLCARSAKDNFKRVSFHNPAAGSRRAFYMPDHAFKSSKNRRNFGKITRYREMIIRIGRNCRSCGRHFAKRLRPGKGHLNGIDRKDLMAAISFTLYLKCFYDCSFFLDWKGAGAYDGQPRGKAVSSFCGGFAYPARGLGREEIALAGTAGSRASKRNAKVPLRIRINWTSFSPADSDCHYESERNSWPSLEEIS